MSKKADETAPPVCARVTCFGNMSGKCRVLVDNDFGGRDCPFYKARDQLDEERARCRERLRRLGIIIR